MKLLYFIFFMMIYYSECKALDSQKCSRFLNDGMYKTYKYGGVGESNLKAITAGTKKDGSSKASSESGTTEPSTRMFDTKYTSNVWTSQTQSTSSWGDCSLFTMSEELKRQRNEYLAQNLEEIKIEMARGYGEHLKVMTFYSACEPEAYPKLSELIQKKFADFAEMNDKNNVSSYSKKIDNIISTDPSFRSHCYAI